MRRTAATRHHRGPGYAPDVRLEHEAAPVDVDQRVALAPLDLLARIVAAGATSLGRLDALAVDNRAARAGLASDPLAIGHDQRVIDLLKEAVVAELGEPTIDRARRWQIAWQQAPRAASPHNVENAVDDLSHRPWPGPSRAMSRRQMRLDHNPLRIGQISLITQRLAAMLLSGGRLAELIR